MTAIEVVTSKEYTKNSGVDKEGKPVRVHVRVWNATVANLTLMALGSSAPEILLNVIEVLTGGFNAGELGPSTIVGSAAFNLMVITAVCSARTPCHSSKPTAAPLTLPLPSPPPRSRVPEARRDAHAQAARCLPHHRLLLGPRVHLALHYGEAEP